jgi:hypothetical protein
MKEDIPSDISGRGKLSVAGVENLEELPDLYPECLDEKERWDAAILSARDVIEFKLALLEERLGAGTKPWSGIFASQSSSVSTAGGETKTSGVSRLNDDVDLLSERLGGPVCVLYYNCFQIYY